MENTKPRLTVSGYRGIWGDTLNEQITFEFGLAFAKAIKNSVNNKKKLRVIIGQDARKTGKKMLIALASAFKKEGIEIDYAGIIPTPSVILLINKLSYDGGILITASHNPIEYNGIKFLNNKGMFLGQDKISEIENIKKNLTKNEKRNKNNVEIKKLEKNNKNKEFCEIHINEILKNIDVNLIKSKKFKVSLDPINSAGSIITQDLLKKLGCKVNIINGEQTGEFTHEAEPLPKNLSQIANSVIKNKSVIGFAQDPDADRLVIVNEKGEVISEEYTVTLAVKSVLSKEFSDIVVNMSTSRMCEDLANSVGKKLFRSKVGELNVVQKMIKVKSLIGGEGGGGVIYPKINMARDSLVGIALILELLAKKNKTISKIVRELPKYIMIKEKYTFSGNLKSLYKNLKNTFSNASSIETIDGIRFNWNDSSWVHIRPSNTEPKTWIISEAKDKKRAEDLFQQAKSTIQIK